MRMALVPYSHPAAAREASSAGSQLTSLGKGQERPAHARADPQGHACLQGRTQPSHEGCAIPQAVVRVLRVPPRLPASPST